MSCGNGLHFSAGNGAVRTKEFNCSTFLQTLRGIVYELHHIITLRETLTLLVLPLFSSLVHDEYCLVLKLACAQTRNDPSQKHAHGMVTNHLTKKHAMYT